MNDSLKNCVEGCNLPSTPNELKILIKGLIRDFENYYKDTTKSLLDHDKKISEMCNYIKLNLSDSVRCLLDTMIESGEFENLVKQILLNTDPVNIKEYGAIGDGLHDDTPSFMTALENEKNLYIPKGTYRITKELTIHNACIISGAGEESILKIESATGLITTKNNTVIQDIKLVGNDENIGISVYQNKQILRNVVFENFNVGVINKNSDYIGTVKFIDLSFDYVKTCFKSTTLTNGVSFNRIVAYHFDNIIECYWMESVGFNNCFFERGNETSRIIKTLADKSNCRAMGVAFNSCYIENVKELMDNLVSGVIKFDSCWLFTKGSFYNYPSAANSLKLLFINCSFGLSSNLNSESIIFNLSSTHQATFNNAYGMINGVGAFELTTGVNIVGGVVSNNSKSFKQMVFNGTTNDNGILKPGLSTIKQRILCVYGYVKDGSSNVYMYPFMNGDNWNVVCRNPLSNNAIANKEVQLRVIYIENTNVEMV